jgi:hypothetical protein
VAEITIVNASNLPISSIRGYVISAKGQRTVGVFTSDVVYPHKDDKKLAYVEGATSINDRKLVLVYYDDSGVRWRKYLDHPSPHKLEDGTPDLPWEGN